jgi:hypothetical protein
MEIKVGTTSSVDALYPKIRVAIGRDERRELAKVAADGRQRGTRGRQPEPNSPIERASRPVNERCQPPDAHDGDTMAA